MSNRTKVLFIGDPHFKVNNNDVIDVFIDQCTEVINNLIKKYGEENLLCVIAGDILDTHERLHQTPYNKAISFIDRMRNLVPTAILVGNHDFENNNQFLNDKHWMNPLKFWENVYIADKVLNINNFLFVPYVPPGRFIEALDTYTSIDSEDLDNTVDLISDWKDAKCIFAHQEIRGCKMGIVNSEHGDKWPVTYPLIISGHIHGEQRLQDNVIYPGSVLQHNFGEENNDTGLFFIDFAKNGEDRFEKIPILVPKLISIEVDCENFESTLSSLKLNPLQKVRLICKGTEEALKRIKRTKLYKNIPIGIKVDLRSEIQTIEDDIAETVEFENFEKILSKMTSEKDLDNILSDILSGKNLFPTTI